MPRCILRPRTPPYNSPAEFIQQYFVVIFNATTWLPPLLKTWGKIHLSTGSLPRYRNPLGSFAPRPRGRETISPERFNQLRRISYFTIVFKWTTNHSRGPQCEIWFIVLPPRSKVPAHRQRHCVMPVPSCSVWAWLTYSALQCILEGCSSFIQ